MKWVLLTIALVLIAFVFDLGLLVYAACAVVGATLFARWVTKRWAAGLTASRVCSDEEVEVGHLVTIKGMISNEGRMDVGWVLIEDVLPADTQLFKPHKLEVEGERVGVFHLASGESRPFDYRIRCNRRGYYQIGPLLMETGDPFGFFRRFKVASEPSFLLVLPKPVSIEGYDIAARRPIGEIHIQHRLFEDPTRISGVRRYELGDPMNRVHWKATARTGVLHSKTYEPSALAGATIVLDFHTRSHVAKHEPYRSEIGISVATSLAHAVFLMGQQVGLVTNARDAVDRIREEGWRGQERSRTAAQQSVAMADRSERLRPVVVPTNNDADRFHRIQQTLARAELTDGLTLAELMLEAEPRLPRDATVVVISPNFDELAATTLSGLVERGFFVTAVVNTYEQEDFARMAGPLVAVGVRCLHLREETSIPRVCRAQWYGR
ncbi:MAG: DUF58 domain-containing protein [Pirellulaceae bacterium]